MNKTEILDALQSLAQSQGFYGRILRNMNDELLDTMVSQKFGSVLDMVMWLEC